MLTTKKRWGTAFAAALCLCAAGAPRAAHAQLDITCGSQAHHRTVCEADTRGGVVMHRQKSSAPCVSGSSWGYTDNAVWVADGCRAHFTVAIPPAGSGRSSAAGMMVSQADALRICRNVAAERLRMETADAVNVAITAATPDGARTVHWTTSAGQFGDCQAGGNGLVTSWTVGRTR